MASEINFTRSEGFLLLRSVHQIAWQDQGSSPSGLVLFLQMKLLRVADNCLEMHWDTCVGVQAPVKASSVNLITCHHLFLLLYLFNMGMYSITLCGSYNPRQSLLQRAYNVSVNGGRGAGRRQGSKERNV